MSALNQILKTDPSYPPAIFLMGPTASGKSSVALEIAHHLPVEIVSVDSAQVYRHMDIGTAKPDTETLTAIPHHLIDLIEPYERYSAGQFRDDALLAMSEITKRGNIPLLVGGTMLYFRTLMHGLSELPTADSELRMTISGMADDLGWPAMHLQLQQIDPVSAARIKSTDSQRIQRALEVCYLANKPMSEILTKPRSVDLPYQTIHIALIPSEREMLHQRISHRFDEMLNLGLVDEVRTLLDKFEFDADTPAMRCVGYRQVRMYLNKEVSMNEMRSMGIAATRQLAKRQLTWLRPMQGLHEFDCLSQDLAQQVSMYLRAVILDRAANLCSRQLPGSCLN